jgi:hypothetical protein
MKGPRPVVLVVDDDDAVRERLVPHLLVCSVIRTFIRSGGLEASILVIVALCLLGYGFSLVTSIVASLLIGAGLMILIAGVAARTTFARVWRARALHTLPDVKANADRLLRGGAEGEFLTVTDPESERFVQFRKYVHGKDELGLELGFPRAPWSEKYYDDVLKLVEAETLPLVLQPTNDSPVTEFLLVDFGMDTRRLVITIARIFHEIFGVPSARRFRLSGDAYGQGTDVSDN